MINWKYWLLNLPGILISYWVIFSEFPITKDQIILKITLSFIAGMLIGFSMCFVNKQDNSK